jgi:pimeloyl-ACP methyl ester carboxylesterase
MRFIRHLAIGSAISICLAVNAGASSNDGWEPYAGSFAFEGGEVITGGPFLERAGDEMLFLYMDPAGLERGGLFRLGEDDVLHSVQPPGIEIVFDWGAPDTANDDRLIWHEQGREPNEVAARVRPHSSRTVNVDAGERSIEARLLLPECSGPHPLVVMVGGSGPTTRWGGTFDTFFVSLGMAVLTYDKRGVVDGDLSENWSEPDLSALADDAAAVLRAGTSLVEVDATRTGFWGSSQGGWVAPMAAAEAEAQFLIVRAGPGVSQREALLHERRQELRQSGLAGLSLDHAMALRREIYRLAESGAPLESTDTLVEPYLGSAWYEQAFGDDLVSATWSQRWWRWAGRNLSVPPGPYLEQLDIPILWFLAERDENVPLVLSVARLGEAFEVSPSTDESLVVLPNANHAFLVQSAEGGVRYSDGYFERLREWLAGRGLSDPGCFAP